MARAQQLGIANRSVVGQARIVQGIEVDDRHLGPGQYCRKVRLIRPLSPRSIGAESGTMPETP